MSSAASPSSFAHHLFRQYDLAHGMVIRSIEDFTQEEAVARPDGQKPLVWYLGHLLVTEGYFCDLYAGGSFAGAELHKRFGRGSDASQDFSDVSKDELFAKLAETREAVKTLIFSLEADGVDRPAPVEVGHPLFKTLGSALSLVVAHNAYHAGQIAVLRRAMGKASLFG
jgi:uncharacterized damage-inducible protein DinB